MPVDEWCDNKASECGSIGVADDPQMNGASVAALRFATEAAAALGKTPDPKWLEVADRLLIPRGTFTTSSGGSYKDVHLMPDKTVPFDRIMLGGKPFDQLTAAQRKANPTAGGGSVCPEDVMYLSYPMGPALNISTELTSRDLDAWIGETMGTFAFPGGMISLMGCLQCLL
jgi:hypothetical protein